MSPSPGRRITVVVGVDGSGRTHRLREEVVGREAVWIDREAALEEIGSAILTGRQSDTLLVVDDAHLHGAAAQRALAAAGRAGVALLISRRPSMTTSELADLDDAAAAQGGLVELGPLPHAAATAALARITGGPVDPADAEERNVRAGGLPGWLAVADDPSNIRARATRLLARLPDRRVASLLAIVAGLPTRLPDDLLARASGTTPGELATALRELREAGLLDPATERLLPIATTAIVDDLGPAERRRVHDTLAEALLARGDAAAAALHLRAAGARTPAAVTAYVAHADRRRLSDPADAASWYELALASGATPADVRAGVATTALLLGQPSDTEGDGPELAILSGIAAAHQGRADRAATLLLEAPAPGPLLAVPLLVATGRLDDAVRASRTEGPRTAALLAEAALLIPDPAQALPALIEAAESFEESRPTLLPDTPHAIAAITAAAIGDLTTAEDVLDQGLRTTAGGPHAHTRLRLLRAWCRLRGGRFEEARTQVAELADTRLPGRERALVAALTAGLARRSGEVSRLREAWAMARPALTRRTVDLFNVEATEELVVAAARVEPQQAPAILAAHHRLLADLGDPPEWAPVQQWTALHVAIAGDDSIAAEQAASASPGRAAATNPRGRAQQHALPVWAAVLAGSFDPDRVHDAADGLAAAGLPWEASRLCGHAAIRVTDAATARRLLERAREVGQAPTPAAANDPGRPEAAGLSEREVEVARLVLAGQTYKEIGAQLYLSPKTVEHHVARIRGKVGAASRAEMVAALRSLGIDH